MITARRVALLAAGLVVALSGCSVQLVGSPVAVPNPTFPTTTGDKAAPTAVNLLGDLPTVDPCSLLDVADLKNFGTADLAPAESLDYCAASLTLPGGAKVDVAVGNLDQLASERELRATYRDYRDDLRIAAEPEDSVGCTRRLVFSDLVTLTITVDNYTEVRTTITELCNPADALTTAVADRVLARETKHRQYQPKSLGKVDPCSLVAKSAVAQVPGLQDAKVKPYPGAHQCRWSRDGSTAPPRLRVAVVIGKDAEPDPNTTREDIAGRPSTITKSGTTSLLLCAVETAHVPFGNGLSERALVTVTLPPGAGARVEDSCTAAKVVASAVWPQLPK